MDNERPIEKLLRDYAKKRRADASEPREMHPATRRLLQGEVARQYPKAERSGSVFWEFLARWRPGLVYAVCVLAVVAISVPLLLTNFRKGKSEGELARAIVTEDQADKKNPALAPAPSAVPAAQEADELRPSGGVKRSDEAGQATLAFADAELPKDKADGYRSEGEKPKSQPARKLATDAPARNTPATPLPAPQIASRDQTQTTAPASVQSRSDQTVRELRPENASRLLLETRRRGAEELGAVAGEALADNRVAQTPATTDSPGRTGVTLAARSSGIAPAPAATALADAEKSAFSERYGLPKSENGKVVQRFAQTATTAGNFRRATGNDAVASPVLATFQLEQTGDQLRVIDNDGSTYTGAITPPAAGANYGATVELKGATVLKPGDKPAAQTFSTPTDFTYQAGQNYSFRVTGTNRTLQQPVVFAGNLLILTNALATGQTVRLQAPAARNQNQITPAQNQLPSLPNSTISGKLQLGTNREMQINAVPVNQ